MALNIFFDEIRQKIGVEWSKFLWYIIDRNFDSLGKDCYEHKNLNTSKIFFRLLDYTLLSENERKSAGIPYLATYNNILEEVLGIVKSEVRQSHSIFLRMFFENIQPVTRHYGAPWGAY
ncbi:MAG: hypothetical protein GY820_36385 [Gammaproteobacteria bacterium]|nr:hypothetical protein [Gammaproteobacteria bacterium]